MNPGGTGDQLLQNALTYVINPLYLAVAVLAFLYFLYGVLMFIIHLDDPDERDKGKSHLLYGLLGLFIIFSLGGLLKILENIFSGLFR